MPSRVAIAALVCTLCAGPGVAAGDDEKERRIRAAAHYEAGAEAFERGDYEAAVRDYIAAHELAPSNALLYNIARAYHLSGDLERALEYYELYLKLEPEGRVAHEAEVFADELRAQIGEPTPEKPESTAQPPLAGEDRAQPAVDLQVDQEPGDGGMSGRTWIAIGAFAMAGIAAGLSGKFGLDARRRKRKLERWDEQWPDDLQQRIDRQERDATLFAVSAAAAGVFAAVGTTLLLWPDGGGDERRAASLQLGPGEALLTGRVRF